jgi:D-beta-D-heptose 7-phosphate kinase/D-beta-D-heptose 1-phosphate adenosyltransferase
LLERAGVAAGGVVADQSRPTTVKRSLIGMAQHRHPQRMFRMDHESTEPISAAVEDAVLDAFERALPGADVVCIEDYNKGVCTERVCQGVIKRCRAARNPRVAGSSGARGVPVMVDPAAIPDYSKYRGATVITPNRTEAALASGMKVDPGAPPMGHSELAGRLLEDLDLEAVVVTLDKDGALLVERQVEKTGGRGVCVSEHPTIARQVYDVTGAGDMVLAALAGARAHGLEWPDAVQLANVAAGLEVAVFGVVPIPIEQIHREVIARERQQHGGHEKTRTLDELLIDVAAVRRDGKKVVFANGCFDVLHVGHLSLLRRAAALGDFLVVAINTDETVRKLKGDGRPLNTERNRAELLGGLECVDAVLVFAEETPERVIRALKPDVLVKGAEYSVDQIPGAEFVIANGGNVVRPEMVGGISTTRTVEKMRSARR